MKTRGKDLKPRQPRHDKQSPFDEVRCRDCDCVFERQELSKAGRCYPCAAKLALEVSRQLHNKRGEYYEKWLAMTAAAAAVREVAKITGERG